MPAAAGGLPPFLDHMIEAAENVCAGFYFEEGGCWGMALELQSALGGELAVRTGDFFHVYVRIGSQLIDWQGTASTKPGLIVMSADDLREHAAINGTDSDALDSDRAWARECIAAAQALSLTAVVEAYLPAEPGPAPSTPALRS